MKKLLVALLALVMVFALVACGGNGEEEFTWPEEDIEIVVPYNPGGDTDTYARELLASLSEELGVTVSITTMTGSSGTVAANYVKNDAANDGYTCLFWHSSILTNNLFGLSDYSYEAFTNACTIVENPSYFAFAAPKYKDLQGLIDYAKANPGQVVAGGTTGGFNYLATKVFEKALGLEFKYVDCTSAGDAAAEIMAGRMDLFLTMLPAMKDYVDNGSILNIACLGAERSYAAPDVPTLVELGYDNVKVKQTYGFQFPAGTDQKIIDKFNAAVEKCIATDAYKATNEKYGSSVVAHYGADATATWKSEMEYYTQFKQYL